MNNLKSKLKFDQESKVKIYLLISIVMHQWKLVQKSNLTITEYYLRFEKIIK
jgi:hypothetical protein